MSHTVTTDEEVLANAYNPIYNPISVKPVLASQHEDGHVVLRRPLFGPLLFDNTDSDARDHCANERSTQPLPTLYPRNPRPAPSRPAPPHHPLTQTAFLSWLRLSIYLSVVSIAIVISFHLKSRPSPIEKRIALPLGLVFWVLALACLASGFANYIKTVAKYSRKQALVQSGWKTQIVFTIVACTIVAACVLFLATNAVASRRGH
ncbi:hypothetical protein MMC16_001700 [Acarospora aff. strigata]|nr:hypothetical protein [Acarospora aff. strigata]